MSDHSGFFTAKTLIQRQPLCAYVCRTVWVPIQLVNLKWVPIQWRVLYMNLSVMLWTIYLAAKLNATAKPALE